MARTNPKVYQDRQAASAGSETRLGLALVGGDWPEVMTAAPRAFKGRRWLAIEWSEGEPFVPEIRRRSGPEQLQDLSND